MSTPVRPGAGMLQVVPCTLNNRAGLQDRMQARGGRRRTQYGIAQVAPVQSVVPQGALTQGALRRTRF
jgi:hypothetical protein